MSFFILRYTHAEKIWNFLRYDRSNKHTSENELHSKSSSGPIPLFRWSDSKLNRPEETILLNGNVRKKKFFFEIYSSDFFFQGSIGSSR
jgi:hypothetical protein